MTPEGKVKDRVRAILKEHDVWYFMPVPMNNRGIPDFICCVNGKLLAIEAKAGKNKPTALQELVMENIRDSGGVALVVNEDNIDNLPNWIMTLESY